MVMQLSLIDIEPIAPVQDCEWYLPRPYVRAVHDTMGGVDLDPFSCAEANAVVQATRYFNQAQNGLQQDWSGRLYVNCPFTQLMFNLTVDKLLAALESGQVTQAIMVCHNTSDKVWWQKLNRRALGVAYPLERVKFWGPNPEAGGPRFYGQTFFYLASNRDVTWRRLVAFPRFEKCFSRFGSVNPGGGFL